MRILLYGAGPFGSLFAERLTEAGYDVTLAARGKRLKQLREHRVVIENSSTGIQTVTDVKLSEGLHEEDKFDLVIIPMRKNHAMELLPTLAQNRHVKTFLFMMNNAEGPDKLIEALGKERVMIGFPMPGGERDGHIMRMLPVDEKNKWTIPVGEADGSITERTKAVAGVLGSMRGYKVEIRKDMDDWLKCHIAMLIAPLVPAAYATGIDVQRYSRTRDAVTLSVRGMKEAFKGLQAVGVKMRPLPMIKFLQWTPEPVLVKLWSKNLLRDEFKIAISHLEAAKDEMEYLSKEFQSLIQPGGIKTPVLDQLNHYFDTSTGKIPDRSRQIPLNWNGVILSGLVLLVIIAILLPIIT